MFGKKNLKISRVYIDCIPIQDHKIIVPLELNEQIIQLIKDYYKDRQNEAIKAINGWVAIKDVWDEDE